MRRVIFAVCGLLFASAVCGAQQQAIPLNKPPAQPAGAGAVPFVYVIPPSPTGAAMDLIALKVAAEIAAQHMKGVVVVGLSGPDRRITELGTRLRGVLSDSLAKEAAGVKIPDGDAIRNFLAANRIAEDMVYSNALGGWIAKRMHADGYVTARINLIPGNSPTGGIIYLHKRRMPGHCDTSRDARINARGIRGCRQRLCAGIKNSGDAGGNGRSIAPEMSGVSNANGAAGTTH